MKDLSLIKLMEEMLCITRAADIEESEPTFEHFMVKATVYMERADAMYYNAVMLNEVKDIDEKKELNDALDKAINVLQQAKLFANKVGF